MRRSFRQLLVSMIVLSMCSEVMSVTIRNPSSQSACFATIHGVRTAWTTTKGLSRRKPGTILQSRANHIAMNAFGFHEAQQSKEYNVVKVKSGYLKQGPDGLADEVELNKLIEARTSNAVGSELDVTKLEGGGDGVIKYMPSTEQADPIVQALKSVCGAGEVLRFELLDSRWNGNEVMKYSTDVGDFFVKINRVEDVSVFMAEAIFGIILHAPHPILVCLISLNTTPVPKPLHIAALPKVGEFGPGAFLVIQYLPLVPFGSMKSESQKELGRQLAMLHKSEELKDVHKGRFGFVVNNFLSLTPLNNTWTSSWSELFSRRLDAQLTQAFVPKVYGRAALNASDHEFRELGERVLAAAEQELTGLDVPPSLLHGDLWIGNTGATAAGPVMFDPASFFGHSEFDLALTKMFGGFSHHFYDNYFALMPRQPGHESRERIYLLYQYLNQLNLFGDPNVRMKCVQLMREVLGEAQEPTISDDVNPE